MEPLEALRHYFGYTSFRPGQEQIIDCLLRGEDEALPRAFTDQAAAGVGRGGQRFMGLHGHARQRKISGDSVFIQLFHGISIPQPRRFEKRRDYFLKMMEK